MYNNLLYITKMKMNYVICTYGGIYFPRFNGYNDENRKNYLKMHLIVLNSIASGIDKITIVRPKINSNHSEIEGYYDFSNINIDNIKNKIEIIDCENRGISYGQFWTAIENDNAKNNMYDYYYFTEDDYIPFDESFVKKFIDNYNEETFLCLSINYVQDGDNPITKKWSYKNSNFTVPDFSIGILNKESILKVFKNFSFDEIINLLSNTNEFSFSQIIFGYIFDKSGIKVVDLANNYLAVFYGNGNPGNIILVNFNIENRSIERIFDFKDKRYNCPLVIPIDILFLNNKEHINNLICQYLIENMPYSKNMHRILTDLQL